MYVNRCKVTGRMISPFTLTCLVATIVPIHSSCNSDKTICSEGQKLLDSVDFLKCQKSVFASLVARGYYITSLVQTDWQAPEGSITVCQYMRQISDSCMPLYGESGCRSEEEVELLEEMWVRQAVSDTEIYGAHGELLNCNVTREMLNQTEIESIKLMTNDKEHWHHKSSNCKYLYDYNSGKYNHNLDKILRCSTKCDPDNLLPTPFPMFTEEKAYINDKMNLSVTQYFKCLNDVGVASSEVKTNLTQATWATVTDVQWSTCASLKTFVRNCSSALMMCLDQEQAEVVLSEDFSIMINMINEGIMEKSDMFRDFEVTDCDIFGGDVSGIEPITYLNTWLLTVSFIVVFNKMTSLCF